MPKAIVIVNGVNQAKFDPNREYEDIRAEFGIPGTALLIGYIARITAQKEPLNFIRAIAKIPDVPASKFLIVGDGELKPQMIDLATEMQVKDRIIFENFRSDIPSILKAIDIFCLPSLWEGLPIALLEAMSMRKAVVATAIDGTKDLIKNMDNGVLIPPLSPDEIAKAIYTLITDAKLRENLGNEAQKTVQQEFNIRTMTKKIENEYKGCLPSFPKVS